MSHSQGNGYNPFGGLGQLANMFQWALSSNQAKTAIKKIDEDDEFDELCSEIRAQTQGGFAIKGNDDSRSQGSGYVSEEYDPREIKRSNPRKRKCTIGNEDAFNDFLANDDYGNNDKYGNAVAVSMNIQNISPTKEQLQHENLKRINVGQMVKLTNIERQSINTEIAIYLEQVGKIISKNASFVPKLDGYTGENRKFYKFHPYVTQEVFGGQSFKINDQLPENLKEKILSCKQVLGFGDNDFNMELNEIEDVVQEKVTQLKRLDNQNLEQQSQDKCFSI